MQEGKTTKNSPWAVSVHVLSLQSGSAWQQNASGKYQGSGQGQYQQLHTTTNIYINMKNHTNTPPLCSYKFLIHFLHVIPVVLELFYLQNPCSKQKDNIYKDIKVW
jgi:hypothetical protein